MTAASDTWRRILEAYRRRYEGEHGDPSAAAALALLQEFLRLAADRGSDPEVLCSILDAAGRLPPDVDGFREALWCWVNAAADEGLIAPFSRRPVAPGALVITPYGNLAIVTAPTKRPSNKWLQEQQRPVRAPNGPFWSALVLRGGAVVFTAPDVYVVGEPDDDQLDLAIQMGTIATTRTLVRLFPRLVARAQRSS